MGPWSVSDPSRPRGFRSNPEKKKKKNTQPSVFFHRFSCTPKEHNYMKWNSKTELVASERLSVKGYDVLQEPWEEMHMRDPRTSFHFRILTFSLCWAKLTSPLHTRFSVHPCLSVCLTCVHHMSQCEQHSYWTTELSPRPSSQNTASALIFWSLTEVNEFPEKIPRSEGKALAAQVPACRCVWTGQRWPGARGSPKASPTHMYFTASRHKREL